MRPLRQLVPFVLLMCMAEISLSAQEERALLVAEEHGIERVSDDAKPAFSKCVFTLTSNVDEVQVEFSALDRGGRAIPDLQAKDVQLIADGKPLSDITSFEQVLHAPITLGILVDQSESIRPDMQLQVVAFSDAVSRILQPGRDQEFAVAFSNHVAVLQSKTSDFTSVKHALEKVAGDHNLTSLFDAIVHACRDQFGAPQDSNAEQRIILLFSDGVDNLSSHGLQDAIEAARASAVTIYAVAPQFGDEEGRQVLRTLTSATGGGLEILRRSAQPDLSVASVRMLARNAYELSFRPPNTQAGFHPLELRAVSQAPLVIDAPNGYFVRANPK